MQEISIFVGLGLDADGISKALTPCADHRSPLSNVAQALMAAQRDSRVEVHDVKLQQVYLDPLYPTQVQVDFLVNWSLYHGCRDQNESDDEYASEGATYTADGHLIFHLPEPQRPSSEC